MNLITCSAPEPHRWKPTLDFRRHGLVILERQLLAVFNGGSDAEALATGMGFHPHHACVIADAPPAVAVEFRREHHFHLDHGPVGQQGAAVYEEAAFVQVCY